MRYYFEDENIVVRNGIHRFDYNYEYIGSSERLVINPNTEKCWLSFSNALKSKQSCMIIGAPSSGKLSTMIDYAKCCGIMPFIL